MIKYLYWIVVMIKYLYLIIVMIMLILLGPCLFFWWGGFCEYGEWLLLLRWWPWWGRRAPRRPWWRAIDAWEWSSWPWSLCWHFRPIPRLRLLSTPRWPMYILHCSRPLCSSEPPESSNIYGFFPLGMLVLLCDFCSKDFSCSFLLPLYLLFLLFLLRLPFYYLFNFYY